MIVAKLNDGVGLGNTLLGHRYIVGDLEEDEPIFVIRGRDAFGIAMLNHYINSVDGLFSIDRMASLYKLREQFRAFGQLRLPD